MKTKRELGFKSLIGISIVLTIFLIAGQSFSLINYDWAVSVGLQESVQEITLLGIAWAKAFAWGDTIAYIPLLIAGIIGLLKNKLWGFCCMVGSLAISIYWPIVNLITIYIGRAEIHFSPDKYISYSIILPLISLYGVWGLWYLYQHHETLIKYKKPNHD